MKISEHIAEGMLNLAPENNLSFVKYSLLVAM